MRIESNGSGAVLPIQDLLDQLALNPLDPTYEKYGDFVIGTSMVWGNFMGVSHVFRIHGTEEELEPIIAAIRDNQASSRYQACREYLRLAADLDQAHEEAREDCDQCISKWQKCPTHSNQRSNAQKRLHAKYQWAWEYRVLSGEAAQ